MKLKKERFGSTAYRVSELALSTSNFSRYASQEESFAILDSFREAGGNFIQTSGICPGVNLGDGSLGLPEQLLGRWLKLRRIDRASVIIATRFAFTRPVIGGLATYVDLVRRCTEDSIRRIDCGYLDFLIAEWTDAIAPVAESVAVFEAVIASGEVRHILPANFPFAHVREGIAASRQEARTIAGLQVDYSLATRLAFQGGSARLCADYGFGTIARSPLAGGHLARRGLRSEAAALPRLGGDDRQIAVAVTELWPALSWIARRHQHSPAQVALSWVLDQPAVNSVLVSVTSADQLRELLAATRLHLDRDDCARLGALPARRACLVGTS